MADPLKRLNYFTGQFLEEPDFKADQAYHERTRRMLTYAMFSPGVMNGLAVSKVDGSRVLVQKGVAIDALENLAEGDQESRLIVITEDQTLNLRGGAGGLNFADGDNVFLYVSYQEDPTDGAQPKNTRFQQREQIQAVRDTGSGFTLPANLNIVLGRVSLAAGDLTVAPSGRAQAVLRSSLVAATPQITLSSNTLPSSGTNNVDVTSSGGLDLSGTVNVTFSDPSGITIVSITSHSATTMTVRLTTTNAAAGGRTMTVTAGSVSASAPITIQAGPRLQGFRPMNQPGNDLFLHIDGSGFSAPVSVAFSAGGGSFTPFTTIPTFTSPTEIRIPADPTAAAGSPTNLIPANAIVGPIRVQTGSPAVTLDSSNAADVSGTVFDVTPPPSLTPVQAGPPRIDVGPAQNGFFTINGTRFFAGTTVTLPGPVPHNLTQAGESRTNVQLRVSVDGNGASGPVLVTTAGGTVRSANNVTNN